MKTNRDEIQGLDWYARNPAHALHGMRNLTLEQTGAYNKILDLIYLTGDRLEDGDRRIAAECNADIRVYRRIKVDLIALEKITIEELDGTRYIRNSAASKEVARGRAIALAKAIAGAEGGRASARSRGTSSNKNNGGHQAPATAPATARAQHLNSNINNNLTDRLSSVPAREGSAAQPEGPASPSHGAIAESPHAAVRALWASLDEQDQLRLLSAITSIEPAGKAWIVTAQTKGRANYLRANFEIKLIAALKNYTLKAPDMTDIPIP